MPGFGVFSHATALYPGDQGFAFKAEQPANGVLSREFAISPAPVVPTTITVEVFFAGAPGVFEFDVMEADSDVANAFIQIGAAINAVNANNYARLDIAAPLGNFVAVLCKTANANAQAATVVITRHS